MRVHLVDGTYELFRHFYGTPSSLSASGAEVGAVRGVLSSMLALVESGATHIGVATDHVIESFRNELWPGYKTGAGIDPTLFAQFHPLEDALRAMGVVVWPMVDFEADDALAAAAVRAAADERVRQVVVCTPDKDLAQVVSSNRIVQLDRRAGTQRDARGVHERFGVDPSSIPDYLALVGDSADGFPGLPGWGEKSASTVIGRYARLEDIPRDATAWDVQVRGATKLAGVLRDHWDEALLFRLLATLRTDVEVFGSVDDLEWRGPQPAFFDVCAELGAGHLFEKARRLR